MEQGTLFEDPLYIARRITRFASEDIRLAEPVPLVIRNAPIKLMKELEYGKGYQYAHDTADKLTDMQCLPDSLLGREYYRPTEEGVEARFKARLQEIKDRKAKAKTDK